MNECHVVLTMTLFQEETKDQRELGVRPVLLFSISWAWTLIQTQDLRVSVAFGLNKLSLIFFLSKMGMEILISNPCKHPDQNAEAAEHGEKGEQVKGSLGWSRGSTMGKQVNQSPQAEGGAAL